MKVKEELLLNFTVQPPTQETNEFRLADVFHCCYDMKKKPINIFNEKGRFHESWSLFLNSPYIVVTAKIHKDLPYK